MKAAIVVLANPAAEQRQWAQLLRYCAQHGLQPTVLVRRDPAAAVTLAAAGHVDVVVAAHADLGGVLTVAEDLGVQVRYCETPNNYPSRPSETPGGSS